MQRDMERYSEPPQTVVCRRCNKELITVWVEQDTEGTISLVDLCGDCRDKGYHVCLKCGTVYRDKHNVDDTVCVPCAFKS